MQEQFNNPEIQIDDPNAEFKEELKANQQSQAEFDEVLNRLMRIGNGKYTKSGGNKKYTNKAKSKRLRTLQKQARKLNR